MLEFPTFVQGAALGEGERVVAVGTRRADLRVGALAAVVVAARGGVHEGFVAVAGNQLKICKRWKVLWRSRLLREIQRREVSGGVKILIVIEVFTLFSQ